mgnify:CR=1 FL=1
MKLEISLSDKIYHELMAGLEQGLDYDEIRLKYENTKGSLYNALSRIFSDAHGKMSELSSQIQAQKEILQENEARVKSLREEANKVQQAVEVRRQELAAMEKEMAASDHELKDMTILLVDDEQDSVDLAKSLLMDNGFNKVITAKSGREAIGVLTQPTSSIKNDGVDLLLVDITMPEVDGYQVCQYIKEQEGLKDIPIIMATTEMGVENLQKAFDVGALDYIPKPTRQLELLARVKAALLLKKEIDMRKRREFDLLEIKRKLEENKGRLQQLSIIDPVTGLANRRHFDSMLRIETRRALRGKYFLSLIKASIDHLEQYNDTREHQLDDKVLVETAKTLRGSAKRVADFVAYCGNGEFYIILPMTDSKGALHVAQNKRSLVESMHINHEGNTTCEFVTLSFGVATVQGELGLTSSKLTAMADEALYRAQRAGGNKVVAYKT